MDWANDNARLSHDASGVRRIFKYHPRPSKVIKIGRETGYQAQVWSLESHRDWTQWLNTVSAVHGVPGVEAKLMTSTAYELFESRARGDTG
ncbi:hypothetical protein CC86DRAFT_409868 [Ophiobolus disseminans]|uniref:Uncharacterized protein n=1 Tax=Ophiobolus disseminans TaxID=1469910 RepID=A0A6A6ZPU0_9PLEO|nr:hypothetical protein CC86DRAFT_409868 [Ophiobolus disseminans]